MGRDWATDKNENHDEETGQREGNVPRGWKGLQKWSKQGRRVGRRARRELKSMRVVVREGG